jgi:hypothetical protein
MTGVKLTLSKLKRMVNVSLNPYPNNTIRCVLPALHQGTLKKAHTGVRYK